MIRDDPNLYLIPKLSDLPWHQGQACTVRVGSAVAVSAMIGYSLVITQCMWVEDLPKFRFGAETEIVQMVAGIPVKMTRSSTAELISISKNQFTDGLYMMDYCVHP